MWVWLGRARPRTPAPACRTCRGSPTAGLGHRGRPDRARGRVPAPARELRGRHAGAVRRAGDRAGRPGRRAAPAGRRRHRDHRDAAPLVPARAAARMAGGPARRGSRRVVHDGSGRVLPVARRMGRPLGRHAAGRIPGHHRAAEVHPARHPGDAGRSRVLWAVSRDFAVDDDTAGRRCRRRVRGLLPARHDRHGARPGDARPGRPRAGGERERRRRRPEGPRDRLISHAPGRRRPPPLRTRLTRRPGPARPAEPACRGDPRARTEGLRSAVHAHRSKRPDPRPTVVLQRRPAHRGVPHRRRQGPRDPAGGRRPRRRGPRCRRLHLGGLAVVLTRAARSSSTPHARSTRRPSLSSAAATRAGRTPAACSSG